MGVCSSERYAVVLGYPIKQSRLVQHLPNIGTVVPALDQRWPNLNCYLGCSAMLCRVSLRAALNGERSHRVKQHFIVSCLFNENNQKSQESNAAINWETKMP